MTRENVQSAQSAQRPQNAARDLYGLDAVVPFCAPASARGEAPESAQNQKAGPGAAGRTTHKEVQPSASVRRIEQHLTAVPARTAPQPAETAEPQVLLPFPGKKAKHGFGIYLWFALCVLLPVAVASVYFGFFASNQYVTEFRFTVQDATLPSTTPSMGGIMSMLGGGGGSVANDSYIVTDYLASQQAAEELQKRIKVKDLYSKPGIDWWSRFDRSQPMERFVKYWQSMVTAQYDLITGIATAQIRAFSPHDAQLIANTLLALSEELVNKMANRSQVDAIRFAEREVGKAQDRLKRVRADLTVYRNKFGVIDPNTSVAASNSALIQSQRANLAQLETQLATLQLQNLAPNAPAILTLRNQVKSTKEQLARTESDVGRGNNGSALSTVVGDYEQLNLELQFAQAMVTSTMAALDQARANAAAQHLYITPYVRPSLPESSTYPNRILSVVLVGLMAFAFWVVALMIVRSIRERFG